MSEVTFERRGLCKVDSRVKREARSAESHIPATLDSQDEEAAGFRFRLHAVVLANNRCRVPRVCSVRSQPEDRELSILMVSPPRLVPL